MEKSILRLRNKAERVAFVEAELITSIAHQIRVNRQARGLSQKELAKLMGTTQTAVSRLEDPSYGRFTVRTLLDLSHVFDVGLQVRFMSTISMLEQSRSIKRASLVVKPFETEVETIGFHEAVKMPTHVETISTSNHVVMPFVVFSFSPTRTANNIVAHA